MKRHVAYLRYVLRHKWFVFLACRRCRVGVIQSIIHDWHKFLPSEWFPYAATFYAPDGSKQYRESDAFSVAWLRHQQRGKHHWQNWLITWDRGTTEPLPMPEKYVREMVADWLGAGHAINGVPVDVADWKWLRDNVGKIRLHPLTRHILMDVIAEIGGVWPLAEDRQAALARAAGEEQP